MSAKPHLKIGGKNMKLEIEVTDNKDYKETVEGMSFKINTPYFSFNCNLPIYGNFNI